MFQLVLEINDDIFDAYADFAREAPRLVSTFLGSTIRNDILTKVQTRVTPYPGAVQYPIQWTSELQRKAFFASNGFGKGIPYVRTGALGRSWTVDVEENGQALHVYNSSPAARYVIGERQQQFHKNTGWPDAKPELEKIIEETIDSLIEAWVRLVDSRGRYI